MTMADIRLGLRGWLLADSGIAAVVADRIFPIVLPQGETRTSIVYTRISGQGDHTLTQASGIARPRYQIDSWAQTPGAASSLADMVKDRLDGARGAFEYGSNSPRDSIDVLGAFFTDEREDYDATAKLYRMSRDYFVWFREF